MAQKRILDELTTSIVEPDDYVYMDGQTNGSRKITPDNLVRSTSPFEGLAAHMNEMVETVHELDVNVGTMQTNIGDLSELETSDKSSLVSAINEAAQSGGGGGLTEEVKAALLQIANKVVYIDDQGQSYYEALEEALYPPVIYSATAAKNTIPTIDSNGDLVTTTTGGSTFCGFVFDESVSGGKIDITWDTADHSTLDMRVALETYDEYSALCTHTQNNATYGMTAETTGYTSDFYWYKWGESYQDTGTVSPTMYYPSSSTGHCTVKVPSGYKALIVSVRRNSGSVSENGLPTDNNSFKNWAAENISVKLIGGVPA